MTYPYPDDLDGIFDETTEGRLTTYYWLRSRYLLTHVHYVSINGEWWHCKPNEDILAVRPVLIPEKTIFDDTYEIKFIEFLKLTNDSSVLIFGFGEYPQTVVPDDISEILEKAHQDGSLKESGRKYSALNTYKKGIPIFIHQEYKLGNTGYVRIGEAQPFDKYSIFSNGRQAQKRTTYWFEIEPIQWLFDPETGILVAKDALFMALFDDKTKYDGNFESTLMYTKILSTFLKEIMWQSEQTIR